MANPIVLGLDPGFASLGYCLVELAPAEEIFLRMGVFTTKKSSRLQKVLAREDNFVRAQEIAKFFRGLAIHYDIRAVCAEAMSFPRSASVSAKMALTWGVLAAYCEYGNVPMVQPSPQEIKRALTGRVGASKLDVQNAIVGRYPLAGPALEGLNKTKREHAADAFGAIVASLDGEIIRLLRGPRL